MLPTHLVFLHLCSSGFIHFPPYYKLNCQNLLSYVSLNSHPMRSFYLPPLQHRKKHLMNK
ncbi:hypothetical protein Lalb_Chr23g0270601 [Lupinus albus]|uniref:Uncharacterized protein n=1 Tax=Lupinus albus TaxID=3870 RepID=A0A6A4NIL6_LUPAL|nr:hypothetical protein Lalb_Chr23g0270601 [Lupinus albus]